MGIPTSFNQVTIGQYIKADAIIGGDLDNIQKNIHLAMLFTGKSEEEICTKPIPEIAEMVNKLKFLYNASDLATKPNRKFMLNGVSYTICWDVKQLTGGQFVDLSNYCKSKESIMENMHKIIAVMTYESRWLGYKYDKVDERAQIFYDDLPLSIANPMVVFFWNVWCKLLSSSQISSMLNEAKTRLEKMKNPRMTTSSTTTGS